LKPIIMSWVVAPHTLPVGGIGLGPTVQAAGGGGAAVVVISGGWTTGGVALGFGVMGICRAVLRVTDMAEVLDANDELGVADTVTVLGVSIPLHRSLKKGWTWDEALDYFQACPVGCAGLLRE